MTLLPREHGAYGQVTLPVITSLVVSGVSGPAALLSLSVVSGFRARTAAGFDRQARRAPSAGPPSEGGDLAGFLGAAIVVGREKTLAGEIAAALAFSFVAYPVSVASGAPAGAVVLSRPSATLRLRSVGWTLAGASAAATIILSVALAGM
jgi:hypothetical protein